MANAKDGSLLMGEIKIRIVIETGRFIFYELKIEQNVNGSLCKEIFDSKVAKNYGEYEFT